MAQLAEKTGFERSYVLGENMAAPFVGVVYGATAGEVMLPSADGAEIVGVIQASGVKGEAVSVVSQGVTRVAPATGATWAVGDTLTVEAATGKFKKAAPAAGVTVATVGAAEDAVASGNAYGLMAVRFGTKTGV